MTWRLVRTRRRYENRATSRICSMLRTHSEKAKNCSRIESYKLRRFATSAGSGKSVSMSAMGPPMNIESCKRTLLRPTPLARWCASLALLSATASPALSFSQGTREQRLACTPDALRLCSEFIPDADAITSCLREKNAELSDACRNAIQPEMTQIPGVSDGTGARERTAR
jgi:hypothetical protein